MMGETTLISWCDHTFNPWMGCTKLSPACDGCYAEALMDKRYRKVQWGPHGERVRTSASNWQQPRRWNKRAVEAGTRPFVFCASLADVFDNQVDPAWRADLFALIRETPQLVWLLLTKRPQNIVKMSEAAGGLPRNAALGATVEDQTRASINVPHLLDATRRLNPNFAFLFCEPLLGPIHIAEYLPIGEFNGLKPREQAAIHWIITGGETDQGGHRARPTNPEWFRILRRQAENCGAAFHHKQNGEWVSVSEVEGVGNEPFHTFDDHRTVRRVGKNRSGRTLDGVTHDERPEVLA